MKKNPAFTVGFAVVSAVFEAKLGGRPADRNHFPPRRATMTRLAPILSAFPLVFASLAVAQAPPGVPVAPAKKLVVFEAGGMPPGIGIVDGVQGKNLKFRQTLPMPKQETRDVKSTRKVVEEGKEREVTETAPQIYTVIKPSPASTEIPLADVRVFDSDAKPIAADRLPGLFARPRMVLFMNAGSDAVDPSYLKIARDDTPFLVIPPMPMKMIPVAMPSQVLPSRPAPPAAPNTLRVRDAETDRLVAGLVLGLGGRLRVELPNETGKLITAVGDVPPGPFQVREIYLPDKKNLQPDHFASFATLDGLRLLLTHRSPLSAECIARLTSSKSLVEFQPAGSGLTGAGLAPLGTMPTLRRLNLADCPLNDADLDRLLTLKDLSTLNVAGTKIGDAGVRKLSVLPLRALWLAGTGVTDAAVADLRGLTSLKVLDLGGTAVTADGLRRLKAALPGCNITPEPPPPPAAPGAAPKPKA
jgi:hypothetical protein